MTSQYSRGATQAFRVEKRYWRRIDPPVTEWWPWGLLPLLGLLFLFLFGAARIAPGIQSATQQSVADNLQQLGIGALEVVAKGQIVKLSGVVPEEAAERIRAIARGSECSTWVGSVVCPTEVELDLVPREAAAEPAPARLHDFEFATLDGVLRLMGEVPDENTRELVLQQAKERFSAVEDQLTVSGDLASGDYLKATERALQVLEKMEFGNVIWVGGVLDATGVIRPDLETSVTSTFNALKNAPKLGKLSLQVAKDTTRCNEEFRAALQQSSVKFGSSSATIDPSSESLLASLSKLANDCSGNLIVEGHTDDTGSEPMNQNLSQDRADAVRDALIELGVAADRLEARGFGETQPIADNATEAGRARNRRIVIRVAEEENTLVERLP